MKKLLIFLALFAIGVMAHAQSTYSYPLTISGTARGHFWDYSDTLTDAQTLDALIRIKSSHVEDMTFQVVFDELTGAATGTLTILGSNDGVVYAAAYATSTITAALTADGCIWATLDDFNCSYIKVLMTLSGTQTSTMKCYYSIREE
jgi:hypothetical protein